MIILDEAFWFLNIIGIIRFSVWVILKYIPSLMYKKWELNETSFNPNGQIKPCNVTAIIPVFYHDLDNVIKACYTWKNNGLKKILLVANNDCYYGINHCFGFMIMILFDIVVKINN